jgi:hypothetical protein
LYRIRTLVPTLVTWWETSPAASNAADMQGELKMQAHDRDLDACHDL